MENTTALITIKQLPVIEEQLKLIKEDIQGRVDTALAMVCTEETVKDIKVVRAALTKEFNEIEAKRKEVKAAVMSPYEQFEAVYRENITDIFKPADAKLKAKIDEAEQVLKDEKSAEVEGYFGEYLQSVGVDFVDFSRTGINVTLSASTKSLKEQAKAFVDKISDDLTLIDTQEHKAEILVEYKNTLNVSQAITAVVRRHEAVEAEKARQEEVKARQEAQAAVVEKVEAVIETAEQIEFVPVVQEKKSEFVQTYSIKATPEQFLRLERYMADNEIIYTTF